MEKISDLNDLIMQGQNEKAIDTFYHKDVTVQRNDEAPLIGKEIIQNRIASEMKNIIEFKSAKPLKVTIGEKTTMVEWRMNYSHKLEGEMNYTQVAVQNWEDGLIIKEKVYCGNK